MVSISIGGPLPEETLAAEFLKMKLSELIGSKNSGGCNRLELEFSFPATTLRRDRFQCPSLMDVHH